MKHVNQDGVHFLWFTIKGTDFAFTWECSAPVWWLPKIKLEKQNGWCVRVGWLLFAIGFGKWEEG